jgi:hypothetical protein
MAKKKSPTRHRLTEGGFGRWEETDTGGNVFVDYQKGEVVENLTAQELEFHGWRFEELADGDIDEPVYVDTLRMKVMDARVLIREIEDRNVLNAIVEVDKRPGVVGAVQARLKELPKG